MILVLGAALPVSALLSFDTSIRLSTRGLRAHAEPGALVMAGPNAFGLAYIEPVDGPSPRVYFKRSVKASGGRPPICLVA